MKKAIAIIVCLFPVFLFSGEGKFLLIMGPSGAGKSTMIQLLMKKDPRFSYVTTYTTRDLREGETEKIHMDLEEIRQLEKEGQLLSLNYFYGIYYATLKSTIDQSLSAGHFPILDWPVEKTELMQQVYGGRLFAVYLEPESVCELEYRLSLDNRDMEGKRIDKGRQELLNYYLGLYDAVIDFKCTNKRGLIEETAEIIYREFLNTL